jgi:hypothetical protein
MWAAVGLDRELVAEVVEVAPPQLAQTGAISIWLARQRELVEADFDESECWGCQTGFSDPRPYDDEIRRLHEYAFSSIDHMTIPSLCEQIHKWHEKSIRAPRIPGGEPQCVAFPPHKVYEHLMRHCQSMVPPLRHIVNQLSDAVEIGLRCLCVPGETNAMALDSTAVSDFKKLTDVHLNYLRQLRVETAATVRPSFNFFNTNRQTVPITRQTGFAVDNII